MTRLLFVFTLLFSLNAFGQFEVPQPIIGTGDYTITDTVYMDPFGDDNNPGTIGQPLKTFQKAVQKLPFGTAGIRGGHAYGLIRLKPGYYETVNGFNHSGGNWKNGNTYKNISIEGIGDVTIGGTPTNFATGHLLVLEGNHIFIKNIKLKYSIGIGLLTVRNDLSIGRQNNVLIDNVTVDSVGNFSMLLRSVDTILVKNSKSLYSSRPGSSSMVSPCQWPSGIKFFDSKYCTIYSSEIAYTRGEGLNFHNSQKGIAYQNSIHDNGLNFYNDNSARLIIRNNHIYNTPGIGPQYWRNCPADTAGIWASSAFLIANEGSCLNGNGPSFDNCQTNCKFPTESFPNVDSMFIYNNVIQNIGTAFGFWEGSTGIIGVNCIRNVFIHNNTIIGTMGMNGAGNNGMVTVFYPGYNIILNSFYATLQNVRISNNIFTYDTSAYPLMRPVMLTFHPQHPGPTDITFQNNLWIKNHTYKGLGDEVRSNMTTTTYLLSDSMHSILPCPSQNYWVKSTTTTIPYMQMDYLGKPRNLVSTNVGALEYNSNCSSAVGLNPEENDILLVFPNPCINCNTLKVNLPNNSIFELFSSTGSLIEINTIVDNEIKVQALSSGIYFLSIETNGIRQMKKLVIVRD